MSTYLPAPYEAAPDDDLGSAAAATLTAALGGLIAVSLASQAWRQYPETSAVLDGGRLTGDRLAVVLTTVGWAAAAVLMGLGALLLIFRRGRGALVLGSLIGIGTTAMARYVFDWFTPVHPLTNVVVYFGGVAVLILAMLPQTSRWIRGRRQRTRGLPPVTSATPLAPTFVQVGPAR